MTQLNKLILKFNRQLAEIQPEGYILQGSVVQRKLQRRVGATFKTYGPYYLWTRKIKGKTVTLALTDDQARIIRQAINRNRELERRLDQLRSLSEQIIIEVSPSVVRRKRTPKI
jgi:hypothetical protein